MNKFTRSQMGKIMACALSAAMAVTVVPTYMKPMTAYAASQSVSEDDAEEIEQGTVVDKGDTIAFTAVSDGSTTGSGKAYATEVSSVINLYAKKGDTTPAYTIKEILDDSDSSPTGKALIPYDSALEAGNYYVEIVTTWRKESDPEDTTTSKTEKDERFLIVIQEATVVTGVSLTATNKTIYYNVSGSDIANTNEETISTVLKGADNAKYESIKYTVTSDADKVFQVSYGDTSNEKQIPKYDADDADNTTINIDDNDFGDLSVKMISPTDADGAKLTILVEVTVAGRENPLKSVITLTASETLDDITAITLNAQEEMILAGGSTTITTNISPVNSTEKYEYELDGDNTDASGTLKTKNNGSIIELYDEDDNAVYATFNTETGELVAKKYGEYTVTADSIKGLATSAEVTVTALDFEFEDTDVEAGKTGDATLKVSPDTVTAYATYSVEDTSIANVIGTSTSFSIVASKPGVTKVNADITVYAKDVYKFEASDYIVVLPKDGDEDFKITDINNTEAYINQLASLDELSSELSLQVANGIINGDINAKVLSSDAIAAAEEQAEVELSEYYSLLTTGTTSTNNAVTISGLLFAAYDKDVVAVENPASSVKVNFVVSDLHAGDEESYKMEGSICEFVAEMTIDGKVAELQSPVWLTVTDPDFKVKETYTVYDNGEPIYVAKCTTDGELTFQTTSFSVFSIVETPGATPTDFAADIKDDKTELSDIYDKVNFVAHVQRRIGTDDKADIEQTLTEDGIISIGTHGQSRRIEKITLTGIDADQVEMTAHVQKRVDHPEDIADLTQVVNEDGSISIGTEHQSRRIEAFSMNLKGDLAEQYDVYYRVHAQNYGWLGWAKNGEVAGTSGHSFRLEGIEIIFVEKGTEFDETQYQKTAEEGDRGYSAKAAYMDRVSK